MESVVVGLDADSLAVLVFRVVLVSTLCGENVQLLVMAWLECRSYI